MQDDTTTEQILRNNSHDNKFHTFGYSKLFARRARKYGWWISFLTKVGFIVPAMIGTIALGYGIDSPILKQLIYPAILLTSIQFIVSLWATLSGWDRIYSYALEASTNYSTLSSKYKNLATFSAKSLEDLRNQYNQLSSEHDFRTQLDTRENIKEWELRYGMRTSLREHQKACVGCKVIPNNNKSTDCDICGNFSFKHKILNQ